MRLVTIAACALPHDADLARNALEGHGIRVYVGDAFLPAVNPIYSRAAGGIRLQVAEEDVEYAAEVLGLCRPEQRCGQKDASLTCPRCGGNNTRRILWPVILAFFVTLGFLLPFFWRRISVRCVDCDTKWRP